jgi:DNA polymerase-3 subunit delta
MKIAAGRVDGFLRKPDPKVRAVLVYGPDTGQVRERARALVVGAAGDAADPFRVAELTATALREDPTRLVDEANALSLMGGRRAVWVREATDGLASLFEALLEGPATDTLVVVEGSDLGARAPLRALFEGAENAAALPCYVDEGDGLEGMIRSTLSRHGLVVADDAVAFLSQNLVGDRMLVRGELDKLALYCAGAKEVSLEDAQDCVGDSAEADLDDVAYAAAGGDQAALGRALKRVAADGTSPITVLRAAARHFQRLHLAASLMAGGASADRAMGGLRPPLFFKRKDAFRAQLARWSTGALVDALEALAAAEADCKTTGIPAQTVSERALIALAARAGRNLPRSP